jgi:hypothetical protein
MFKMAHRAKLQQSGREKKQNNWIMSDLMKNFCIINPTGEISKAAAAVKSGRELVVTDESGLFVLTSEEKITYFMAKIAIDDVKDIYKRISHF